MKQKVTILRFPILCLAFIFTMAVALGFPAAEVSAEEAVDDAVATETPLGDSSDASGIKVTTSTDKESYGDGDTAVVTVSVTNTNTYDMTDVSVAYNLPANFSVTSGENTQTLPTLASGETKEFQISAVVTEDPYAEVVLSSYFTPFVITLIALAAVVVIIAIIFIVRKMASKGGRGDGNKDDNKNNKKGPKSPKTGISMLLVMALLTASISYAAVPVQAKTKDGLIQSGDYLPRVSVHDPSIVKDPSTGMYYVFGSHRAWAKSKDLINWETFMTNIDSDYENIFAEPWEWAKYATRGGDSLSGRMWAPDVIWNDTMKKWCMYMSIDGDDWCSAICLLTADNIEGPYEYKGIVVYSGMNNEKNPPPLDNTDIYKVLGEGADLTRYKLTADSCINAIDPNVRYDDKGDLYMVYGSWSAGIYMLKLDTKTGLRDYETKYETKMDVSDAYLGTKIAGGHYNSGEAPYIIHVGKYYYFFISYAGLRAKEGYQIRTYRSENITGPYVDQNGDTPICIHSEDMKGSSRGLKLFGSYAMAGVSTVQVAQGHNSAFVDDDGKIYLVYHTRFQSNSGTVETHQLRVHQMFVNEDGWLVAAPYEYAEESLAENGYTADEVAGEYDFIYHEPTQYYNVIAGEQYGIIGDEEVTTKEVELQKETIVAHRRAIVRCTVSYSHEGHEKVVLQKDGTVTGDYMGTWKSTSGSNVVMELNGETYKGVFLRQQDESMEKTSRMTFTLAGNNVTVWGVTADLDGAKEGEE